MFSSGKFIADFSHNTLLPPPSPPPSNSQSIWEVSLGCPGPLLVLASRPAPLQVPLLLLPPEICAGDVQELWFWWCESTLWWHACVCRGWYSVRECVCVSRSSSHSGGNHTQCSLCGSHTLGILCHTYCNWSSTVRTYIQQRVGYLCSDLNAVDNHFTAISVHARWSASKCYYQWQMKQMV